ncbi:hypothetical protein AG1IA_00752 [Rhizoctonia solani AG-1 IA]|uniref:Uncharacterized protein n=1 Tax=Thanatephorus cucumeris (strain AG1-IA) TaxID=983506 RepID=L8X813_THACA|nr:hypothetical protein AG1IA_00752 [Rhizoctonia solani AG-1 IA]
MLSSELVTDSADSVEDKIGEESELLSDESSVVVIPGGATTVARLLSGVWSPAEPGFIHLTLPALKITSVLPNALSSSMCIAAPPMCIKRF